MSIFLDVQLPKNELHSTSCRLVKQTLRPLEEMDFSLHGDRTLRDGDGDERFVGLMDSKQVSKQICLSI